MKICNVERQVITMYETKLVDKQDMKTKTHVVATHTVICHPSHLNSTSITTILHRKYTNKHTTRG